MYFLILCEGKTAADVALVQTLRKMDDSVFPTEIWAGMVVMVFQQVTPQQMGLWLSYLQALLKTANENMLVWNASFENKKI